MKSLFFTLLVLTLLNACASKKVDSFKGSIDRQALQSTIKTNQPTIEKCYDNYLKIDPDAKGKMVIKWVISEKGGVSEITVEKNPFNDDSVFNCIAQDMKNWQFPRPDKGLEAVVTFPFLFNTHN
jgi:hypothetical protein